MRKALAVIDGNELTEKGFMDSIDNELIHLHDTGDINRATNVIRQLDALDNVSGHAKARFLWGFHEWWKVNRNDENFADHVDTTTETKPVTVKRYIKTWQYIEDCVIPKEIAVRPMRELVPIASHLSQGYDLSAVDWRKINTATNLSQIGEVLRTAKGRPARKNAKVIRMERDGSLYGYKGEQKYFIGFLNIKDAETDATLAEFIEKIKISAGILES